MRFALFITLTAATPLFAQDGLRDTDARLTQAELTEAVSGQVLEFFTDGLARFQADGAYDYRYGVDEPPVKGVYIVMEDSQVCVTFENGFDRCDYLVRAGDRLVMVIENGERYPVRNVQAIAN